MRGFFISCIRSSRMQKVIIPPFFGEFGVMVMEHLRYVHVLQADQKIVCCERGQECLFPSATEFFTDFTNPVEDANRVHHGPFRLRPEYLIAVDEIYKRVVALHPNVPIVKPEYPSRQQACRTIKFKPAAAVALPSVDIAICPRYRQFSTVKNWSHWTETVQALHDYGFTIGIAGTEDTCFSLSADAYAWNHPAGATAGAVDLLAHCRLYLGTDTGVSHLAALMDTPQLVFGYWDENNPNCTNMMQISNRKFCRVLLEAWDKPEQIITAALAYLR